MKKLKLIIVGVILMVASATQAQVSVNVNIGHPPVWGPVGTPQTDYYYIPDIETYYDLRTTQFIYYGSGKWIRSNNLPHQYRSYNLHNGYKVVLNDYHGRSPYTYFKSHKVKYYKGYKGNKGKSQKNSSYSHDNNHEGDHGKEKGNKGKGNGKH